MVFKYFAAKQALKCGLFEKKVYYAPRLYKTVYIYNRNRKWTHMVNIKYICGSNKR
jgi:hypothetical protein